MKCFVVDDEAHALQVLARYIEKTPGLELTGVQENPLEALRLITEGIATPDITFIDVDMPQLSGVELAALLNSYTTVVFTTAYSDYAYQAYEKNAVDYLLKPITYERFLKAVGKVRDMFAGRQPVHAEPAGKADYFFVKSEVKGKIVRVDIDEIEFVEAWQNYIKIHTGSGTLTTYLTMKEVEEHLPMHRFSRIHKSFIVHNDKVRALEGNQVILSNKKVLSLGASYRADFLEAITARLLKSKRTP
ncbi:LytTR family DNA-binding domain-containing protein [Pontibacter sp. SGAir0037]|uniref:LytR/AlgR family response regulator transcription factor n=1 Tax=Pontibacter sp. SGAir0037 TaxID=2571030 RepID=UPI0010CCBB83|nr:LytTR family DNA-binding domain-containing protein [Pontibacter sp. SGAir0037]QCR22335.1 DNA-binding response regulator [Pontibacter sp. SGAir0037]